MGRSFFVQFCTVCKRSTHMWRIQKTHIHLRWRLRRWRLL